VFSLSLRERAGVRVGVLPLPEGEGRGEGGVLPLPEGEGWGEGLST